MSGGKAFLLDADPELINRELVDLDPVTGADADLLHDLVQRHYAETGSAVAEKLLDGWDPTRFIGVIPRDYKKVLDVMRAAEAAGRDVNAAVMEVARA
jgi:glutamate synthase (NADPH/NADH) large chain